MFRPLLNGLRSFRLSRKLHSPASSAVDRTAFEAALVRERARTDRNGQAFSVLNLRLQDLSRPTEYHVLDLVDERLRPYDLLCVLHPGEVAALLPETDREGAGQLAKQLLTTLQSAGYEVDLTVYHYPEESQDQDTTVDSDQDSGEPVAMRSLAPSFEQPVGFFRRGLDIAVSGTALCLLSPVYLATALAVKATSPGPIIYTQMRAGLGGRPFPFYKFRSMYVDADQRLAGLRERNEKDGPIFKMKNDPRMTPIGKFLRRMSIDELPQLWNVFCGDMTLIGPRPPRVEEVRHYEPWQKRRLMAKGGLTCIWQVSGRSEIGFVDWVRMDLKYIDKRSIWMDLSLLSRTFWAVVSGRGAY